MGSSVGAVGVVFNLEGKILLVEHAFHPKMPWGLPGGWVSRREDPATTVRREIKEELSLDIEVGPLLLTETPYPNHLDLAYMCRTDNPVGVLNYELLNYQWFEPEQLPEMSDVHRRAIQCALIRVKMTGI